MCMKSSNIYQIAAKAFELCVRCIASVVLSLCGQSDATAEFYDQVPRRPCESGARNIC